MQAFSYHNWNDLLVAIEEGKEQWIEKTIQCETLSVSCQPTACKVMHL